MSVHDTRSHFGSSFQCSLQLAILAFTRYSQHLRPLLRTMANPMPDHVAVIRAISRVDRLTVLLDEAVAEARPLVSAMAVFLVRSNAERNAERERTPRTPRAPRAKAKTKTRAANAEVPVASAGASAGASVASGSASVASVAGADPATTTTTTTTTTTRASEDSASSVRTTPTSPSPSSVSSGSSGTE